MPKIKKIQVNGVDNDIGVDYANVDNTPTPITKTSQLENDSGYIDNTYHDPAKQNVISSSNKVDADLINDTNSTNKFTSTAEKTTWSNKQNAITSASKLSSDLVDDTDNTNKFITAQQSADITQNKSDIATINGKISTQATSTNKVLSESEIDSKIATIQSGFTFKGYVQTTQPTGDIVDGAIWYEASALPTTFPIAVKTYDKETTSWSSETTSYTPSTLDIVKSGADGQNYYYLGGWVLVDTNVELDNITLNKNASNRAQIKNGGVSQAKLDLGLQNKLTEINEKADKTTTINSHTLASDITLTKSDIGLGNVNNTADLDKPVSTATQNALDEKVSKEAGKSLTQNDLTNALKSEYDNAVAKSHTHLNKGLLDTYSNSNADITSAINDKHTHTNKELLDTYNQTNANLSDAVSKKHTHSNKALIDTYTNTNADISSAISDKHTHSNKEIIDGISASDISTWNAKQSALTFDNEPTANSDNPVTSKGIKTYVDNKTLQTFTYKGVKATIGDLPETADNGDIWWVSSQNCNYVYNGSEWEAQGSGVDLSAYVKTSEMNTALANKQDNITATNKLNYNLLFNTPTIPTALSSLTNDVGFITNASLSAYATQSWVEAYHDATKANISSLSAVAFSGSYNDLLNKPTIPTKVSDITNDSGFITSSYHDATKQDLITSTNKVSSDLINDTDGNNKFVSVSEKSQITTNQTNITNLQTSVNALPTKTWVNEQIAEQSGNYLGAFNSVGDLPVTAEKNDTAMVGNKQYKYDGSTWKLYIELNNDPFTTAQQEALDSGINTTKVAKITANETAISSHTSNTNNPHAVTKAQVGLGQVDNTSDLNKPISTATQTALDGKVNVVSGKGLSTNDFTTELKTAYNGAVADKHSHSNKSLLDTYTQTESNIADAVTKKHSHSNKALLDTYDNTNSNITDAVSKKHTHSNKNLLDGLTATDISNWNLKQDALTFDTTPTANSTNPVTSNGIKVYIDNKLETAVRYKGSVATISDLPASAETGDMYWVVSESANYVYNGSTYDKQANSIDLSAYAQTTWVNTQLNTKQNTINSENKLSYNYLIDTPTIPSLTSQLTNDSNFLTEHQSLSAYRTAVEQNEIDDTKQNIISSTNKVSADFITETATKKFVSPSEKTTWGNKSVVSGSNSGTATNELKYLTIDGNEWKVSGKDYTAGTGIVISGSTIAVSGNVALKSDLPTNLSDLVNDEGFITASYHDNTKQNVINNSNKISSQYVDDTGANNKFITAEKLSQIDTNTSDISSIETNYALKTYVDNAVALSGGKYWGQYNSVSELPTGASNNDTANVKNGDYIDQYKYNGSSWVLYTRINTTTMTQAQLNAINSGITSGLVAQINTNTGDISAHTTNVSNPHNVSKSQIGLGNVDNTNDLSKPISVATQNALDNKVDKQTGKTLTSNDYTNTEKDKVASAYSEKHTHANKSLLDTYDQTNADLTSAVSLKHTHSNKALLDTYTNTNENISNAISEKHQHDNKALLDTYNQTNTNITNAVDKAHWHDNKAVIDTITQANITAWNNKQNALTFDTTPTADSNNPVMSKGIKSYVDSKLSSALTYKGSVLNVASLPATASVGDMYWVVSTSANYVYNGSSWDKQGQGVDLTQYAKTSDVNSALALKQNVIDSTNKLPYANVSGTPTNVSSFTNDAGYLTEHQSLSAYRTSSEQDTIDATKQAVIDSSHKLSADLVSDSSTTNKFTNSTEKANWNAKSVVSISADGKKITINGTETTLAGTSYSAGTGLNLANDTFSVDTTAIQTKVDSTHKLSADLIDDSSATNKFITSSQASKITANETAISTIESKIPTDATSSNKLADKNYVDTKFAESSGTFKGSFSSVSDLPTTGVSNNDYAYVDETDGTYEYKYNGSAWVKGIKISTTPFTTEQLNALNSGIDTSKVAQIETNRSGLATHIANTNNPHSVNKAQVGLSNVDNTSDLAKPISTATQNALDLKVDKVAGKVLSSNDYTNADKEKVTASYTDKHTHSNKALLDTYDQTNADITSSVSLKHSHTNKSLLDTYDQTNANLTDSVNKKHSHSNKSLLDSYTNTNSDITSAITQKHIHENKAVLDNITSAKFNSWDAKQDTLVFDATPTAGSTNPVTSAGIKQYIDSHSTSAYNYKGTCKFANLPLTGNVGDMWFVTDKNANYVWNGTEWQSQGSGIDLSSYATKTELTTGLATKQNEITNTNKLAYSLLSDTPTIPTKTSDLTNDSNFITNASLSSYRTSADQDIIDNGKQATITNANKLSADLVNDESSTNKFTTNAEKLTWNAKSVVTASLTGTSTNKAKYITINGNEWQMGGETYSAGTNITIANNVISAIDTTYTAGTGITITNNAIAFSGIIVKKDSNGYYIEEE